MYLVGYSLFLNMTAQRCGRRKARCMCWLTSLDTVKEDIVRCYVVKLPLTSGSSTDCDFYAVVRFHLFVIEENVYFNP